LKEKRVRSVIGLGLVGAHLIESLVNLVTSIRFAQSSTHLHRDSRINIEHFLKVSWVGGEKEVTQVPRDNVYDVFLIGFLDSIVIFI